MTISEEASSVLRERFATKNAIRDLETYQQLTQRGLTDSEAGEVIRRRFVEKVSSGVGQERIDFHQRQKDAIADLAISRKVRVGLPQSMATFAGVHTPEMNYSASELAGIKRLLKANIEKVDKDRKAESMIGQNFNFLPKSDQPGWTGNLPSNYVGILPASSINPVRESTEGKPGNPVLEDILTRARGGARAGRLDIDGSQRVPGREPVSAEEYLARINSPASNSSSAGLSTAEDERPSREELFESVGKSSSSSSALRPAHGGGEVPIGTKSASAGGGRGRPPTRSSSASAFDYNEFEAKVASTPKKDQSKVVQRQATILGIDIKDPARPGQNKSKSDLLEEILRKYPPED